MHPAIFFGDGGLKQPLKGGGGGKVSIIDKAIELLKDGAKKVDFDWHGANVTAYWVGPVLRIDIKNLK